MPSAARRTPSFRLPELNMPAFFQKKDEGSRFGNILLTVAFLLLLLILIVIVVLIIIVAVQSHKTHKLPDICTDSACLRSAADIQMYMDWDADPCVDFYQFACGNFTKYHPIPVYGGEETTLQTMNPVYYGEVTQKSLIADKITEKLRDVLGAQITVGSDKNSAEVKVKTFYQSCVDTYFRYIRSSGSTLVKEIKQLGGWYAIPGTYDSTKWDRNQFNDALQNIFTKYGATPFFKIGVTDEWDEMSNKEIYAIQLNVPELGISTKYSYLLDDEYSKSKVDAYRNYIKSFIRLLWKDADLDPLHGDLILNDVVEDIIAVEKEIANITITTPPEKEPSMIHQTIENMDFEFGSMIYWFELFSKYFNGGLTQHSEVHLHEAAYILKISGLLIDYKPQQLNNYMMWVLASSFVEDLGWDYIHNHRDWSVVNLDGRAFFTGMENWCVRQAESLMGTAVSYLFVKDHFVDVSNGQVNSIYEFMMKQLLKRIDDYSWMDSDTKQKAKDKITSIDGKIGYPGWIGDTESVDEHYSNLSPIDPDDSHLDNTIKLRTFHRSEEGDKVRQLYIDHNIWPEQIFQVNLRYKQDWNEIFMPAGVLQPPIYDYRVPQYLNFASIARYLGTTLISTIDPEGSFYDASGVYQDQRWWSNSTKNKFIKDVEQCQRNLYKDATYLVGGEKVKFTRTERFAKPNWRLMAAMDIGYKAYQEFLKEHPKPGTLPGFQPIQSDYGELEQLYYIEFAQTMCFSRTEKDTVDFWNQFLDIPEDFLLNKIVSQSSNFQDAFKCKTEKNPCPGF